MKLIAAVVASVALLAACQTTYQEGARMGARVSDPAAPNARIQFDQVVILDQSLQGSKAGKIAIEQQGARRSPTGTLKVLAVVRNRTDFTQVIEARTSYFDSSFAPTEKPSAWTRIHLDANGISSYEESSMGAQNVAHYYVEIRESR